MSLPSVVLYIHIYTYIYTGVSRLVDITARGDFLGLYCLLTNRTSIATVSIIHTTVMCGQMRIPTPMWKATFNVLVSVWCAVLDDQLVGPFILEGRLTREAYLRFVQEELPRLLEDVPLQRGVTGTARMLHALSFVYISKS